jgi:hypothetical protein
VSLIGLVVTLVVVGVLLWLANTYIPMDAKIKQVLNVVVLVVVVLWILGLFVDFGSINSVRVGKVGP